MATWLCRSVGTLSSTEAEIICIFFSQQSITYSRVRPEECEKGGPFFSTDGLEIAAAFAVGLCRPL